MTSPSYRGYAGLPPLVGLHTMEEAQIKGLTVAESVARLLRLHWSLRRLHGIFTLRITAMPVYEIKMAFSLHAFYCSEHTGDFAARVREMREPPYGLEHAPNEPLDIFFDEILTAPSVAACVAGIYEYAVPAIERALRRLITDTNHLFDHPTYRICRLALVEFEDIASYGRQAIEALADPERETLSLWLDTLKNLLAAAGDLDGTQEQTGTRVPRYYSVKPYVYDGVPQRDERFKDLYNQGVNAEAMIFREDVPPLPKSIMLYFKRMREIDVPEVMSSILAETKNLPWDFYRDMTRQLWDEARHAMMGEIGFVSLGIDWTQIPFNFTWALNLNTQLTPLERHAVLYAIEQGLMPAKTGKRFEWEVAVASADRLTTLIQDYDWADEILHAHIGRDWLVPMIGTQREAMALGDEAWNRVLADWAKLREDGFTNHDNWWPEVYRTACAHWGVEPNLGLLAYSTTYENLRPDLKNISS
ncbi:MAG: hypothetical protein WA634_19440 [Silvibacterium sp.]